MTIVLHHRHRYCRRNPPPDDGSLSLRWNGGRGIQRRVTWFHDGVLSGIALRLDVGATGADGVDGADDRTLEGNLENGVCDARGGNAEDEELVSTAAASCGLQSSSEGLF